MKKENALKKRERAFGCYKQTKKSRDFARCKNQRLRVWGEGNIQTGPKVMLANLTKKGVFFFVVSKKGGVFFLNLVRCEAPEELHYIFVFKRGVLTGAKSFKKKLINCCSVVASVV